MGKRGAWGPLLEPRGSMSCNEARAGGGVCGLPGPSAQHLALCSPLLAWCRLATARAARARPPAPCGQGSLRRSRPAAAARERPVPAPACSANNASFPACPFWRARPPRRARRINNAASTWRAGPCRCCWCRVGRAPQVARHAAPPLLPPAPLCALAAAAASASNVFVSCVQYAVKAPAGNAHKLCRLGQQRPRLWQRLWRRRHGSLHCTAHGRCLVPAAAMHECRNCKHR